MNKGQFYKGIGHTPLHEVLHLRNTSAQEGEVTQQ